MRWEVVPLMLQEGVMFLRSIDASSISELGNGRDEAALMLKCRTDKTDIPTRILQTVCLLGQNLQKLICLCSKRKQVRRTHLLFSWKHPACLYILHSDSQRDY